MYMKNEYSMKMVYVFSMSSIGHVKVSFVKEKMTIKTVFCLEILIGTHFTLL